MIRTEEEHLAHYGILRRSGRYPWGSGGESQRNRSYLDTIKELKKQGMSEAEIARGFGITTTQLRAAKSIALAQQKQEKILTAQRLKEKGWSNVAIGQRMGLNESSVRALLAVGEKAKADVLQTIANMLQRELEKKKYIDIGAGVEHQLGITKNRLNTAVAILVEKGYTVHSIDVQQLGTGQYTTMKVLAKPGTTRREVQRNRAEIRQIQEYSTDHGRSFLGVQPPISISSRRLKVNYAGEGGEKADGVIYIRPGVKDLSIKDNRYAQVRIVIDGTHYLKGMAMYKDDLPEGKDLVFNTSKSKSEGWKSDSNKLSNDPDNPFGSIVRQIHGPDGKVSSAMNIVGGKEGAGEAGYWDTWSRNLSTQLLSKQSPDLAKQQLDLTYERRRKEFDEIVSLTNPTVRKELLLRFGDQADSSAVHLEAANMPRQATKVLLPIPSMKKNEVYAPSMRDGERVALVRFPHGGKFEIPQLTVNNRNREARKLIGTGLDAKDAIGIHHEVAKRLSGADFDGDTVLLIPNNRRSIKSTPALKELQNFDPHVYKLPDDSPIPRISSGRKQDEMGKVSNLITDMSIKGAPTNEIARAVKHSMVVIDSEKHNLDFRQSEKDHGIPSLKEKYQGGKRYGSATLISRAGAPVYVPQRKPRSARKGGPIDVRTGKKVYEETGRLVSVRRTRINPVTGKKEYIETGRTTPKKQRSVRLAETENAYDLIPKGRAPTVMESIYADHANRMKAMANEARKQAVATKPTPYSPSARKVYSKEVSSLDAKIKLAEKNAPYERQAQLVANVVVSQKRQANPNMEPEDLTKIKQQALTEARRRTGAGKEKITITQEEWNAIQAGAISTNKLTKILTNSDLDTVKRLAMPKHTPKLTSAMKRRAESMLKRGYTQAEVADQLGVGLTTLKVGLEG